MPRDYGQDWRRATITSLKPSRMRRITVPFRPRFVHRGRSEDRKAEEALNFGLNDSSLASIHTHSVSRANQSSNRAVTAPRIRRSEQPAEAAHRPRVRLQGEATCYNAS